VIVDIRLNFGLCDLGQLLVHTASSSGVASPDQRSTNGSSSRWADATAGAIAGTVSRMIVAPLDVVKIRFQVRHLTCRIASA